MPRTKCYRKRWDRRSAMPSKSRRASATAHVSYVQLGHRTRVDRHMGVFLQSTCDNVTDLPVPGQESTFDVVKAVQARGDFHVLAERGRRALRTHVGKDVQAGLAGLQALTCSGARHQATSPSCHARDGRSSLWGPHKPSCLSAMKGC